MRIENQSSVKMEMMRNQDINEEEEVLYTSRNGSTKQIVSKDQKEIKNKITLNLKHPNQTKAGLRQNAMISSERQHRAKSTLDHFANEPAFLASSKSHMIAEVHNKFIRKKKSLSPKRKLMLNRLENQTQYGGKQMKLAKQLLPKKTRNARL